eukprot:gene7728-20707_t
MRGAVLLPPRARRGVLLVLLSVASMGGLSVVRPACADQRPPASGVRGGDRPRPAPRTPKRAPASRQEG